MSALPAHRPPALQSLDERPSSARVAPEAANAPGSAARERSSLVSPEAAEETAPPFAGNEVSDGCPRCGSMVRKEVARLVCTACSREWPLANLSASQERVERMVAGQLSVERLYEPSGSRRPIHRRAKPTGAPES